MGNKTQQPQQSHISPNLSKLSIKHPKLSKSIFIQSTSQQQPPYLQLSQSIQSKQIFQIWNKQIHKYKQQNNQLQILFLPKILQFEQKGFCGTSGIVKSKYIFVPFALKQQIENRRNIKQPFLQKQLWYLIYIINLAAYKLHSKNLLIGDIRPQNILMSNDGQICIVCLKSFLHEDINYVKMLINKQVTYLAPEQVQDLKQNKNQPTGDLYLSQDFSIGLTILSAILLKDYSSLYTSNTTGFDFNQQGLHSELATLKSSPINNTYSPLLRQITQSLLNINPKQRLSSSDVIKILKQYEEQIINLDDFSIDFNKIDGDIFKKLGMNGQGRYKKVINNSDFNKMSRINYGQSPRDSSIIGLENSQNIYTHQPQFSKQYKVVNSMIGPNSQMSSSNIVQSHYTVHSSNITPTINVIPPTNPSFTPQSNISMNPPVYRIQQRNVPIVYGNRPQNIGIPQNSIVYGNSFISSPQVVSYNSKINSFIPNQHQEIINYQRQKQNQENQQVQVKQSHYRQNINYQQQIPIRQPLYFQQANQIRPNPTINTYMFPNTSPYPPNQPFPNRNQNSQQKAPQISTNTTQIGRQHQQIRPFSDNLVVSKYDKSKDKIFETYDEVIKNIDETLRQSQKQFPDS